MVEEVGACTAVGDMKATEGKGGSHTNMVGTGECFLLWDTLRRNTKLGDVSTSIGISGDYYVVAPINCSGTESGTESDRVLPNYTAEESSEENTLAYIAWDTMWGGSVIAVNESVAVLLAWTDSEEESTFALDTA